MIKMKIKIRYGADADKKIALPKYHSTAAAGMDLRANFALKQRQAGIYLPPMNRAVIPSGLCFALVPGYEAQIRIRSGLALKYGIIIPNAPATIDADYRGMVGIMLLNLSMNMFHISHGDRIAQLVFAPIVHVNWSLKYSLPVTERASGGFGSTGMK